MTATAPYIILLIFFIRGAMLEGAGKGLLYFIKPDMKRFVTTWVGYMADGKGGLCVSVNNWQMILSLPLSADFWIPPYGLMLQFRSSFPSALDSVSTSLSPLTTNLTTIAIEIV